MENARKSDEDVPEEIELQRMGIYSQTMLGEGSYSKVKLAIWKREENETKIALKIINRATAPVDFKKKFLPRELSLLTDLDHKHIIKMYSAFNLRNKTYICLEHAARGDLLNYVQLKGPLDDVEAAQLFYEMCDAVQFLHNRDIVHRDLKCENILISTTNQIKLADFGFARKFTDQDCSKTFCGSAAYAAPEVIRGREYDAKLSDDWSLGVILFIMVCGLMPFRDETTTMLLQDQQRPLRFPRKPPLRSDLKILLQNILTPESNLRWKIGDIIQHDWVHRKATVPSGSLATASEAGTEYWSVASQL